ncbi:MAG TPA: glutathione S-transferase N-terminal domain-containing protein [Candidatus Paceibacterota bacterium]|nr:glutathione S-transferase N-terminal domain-containing protein [Candidatus Paceibacterota bacterium]
MTHTTDEHQPPQTMELYYRPTCPYCKKVLMAADLLGIPLTLHDIGEPEHAAALIARGGKQQVPYLVDAGAGVEMYESDDIVAYLEGHPHAGAVWQDYQQHYQH